MGSSGARKFLARDTKLGEVGRPWHSVLGTVRFNGLECTVHVQRKCKCFVAFLLLPPLQARRCAPPVPKLHVTNIGHLKVG